MEKRKRGRVMSESISAGRRQTAAAQVLTTGEGRRTLAEVSELLALAKQTVVICERLTERLTTGESAFAGVALQDGDELLRQIRSHGWSAEMTLQWLGSVLPYDVLLAADPTFFD
jgi:hypothetical protein